ncbi:MAG TPA: PAS-domain containing protein [Xanthobacteraceae bacterium]|nr:PAS-domain containing protein [Xanthobacteraceae bacterium]
MRAHPRRGGFLAVVATVFLSATPARAALFDFSPLDSIADFTGLNPHDVAGLALTLGILLFAVVTAVMLVRTRSRAAQSEIAAREEIIALKADVDRAHALLLAEPQVIVAWAAGGDKPEIFGDTSMVTPVSAPHRVLAFGTWLEPAQARTMERLVEALRDEGESFATALTTLSGRPMEAEGRAIGGRAVLRLRDVGGVRRDLTELSIQYAKLLGEVDSLRTLVEALPSPIWARDESGALSFVNHAYARAVEAKNPADAVARGLELLDRPAREELARACAADECYTGRVHAVVAGSRRAFDIRSVPTERGSAGIGIDATEVAMLRAELSRVTEAHRRTLDQLATGVAIFDGSQRLTFYNTAYRALWDLEPSFLDQGPTDSAVLDKLRATRKLPEEQDFRQWKNELHEAYRATEPSETVWYLPDRRTLRVVTTQNPEGGVTYLFDDVTERLDLERRFDALIRVQGETLDNLTEGVVVFGSDGRLRLHNPAFAQMWRLAPETLVERPHIETVIGLCQPLHDDEVTWYALRSAVTAIDNREQLTARLDRRDGSVIDCSTVPLPDGATLVAFHDITDTINVERALREKNEALETADEIKIDFVHHVSYELRSPLTNIIGFAHFLGDPATGPLTDKQREYLGYLTTSTNALLAIINNILDLATIDAGAMTLSLGPVDIRSTMLAAVEGIQDRLVTDELVLDMRVPPDAGSFVADEKRVRQVLFNLLANAVSFSPPGGTITLTAERRRDAVVFAVTDRGPGIPQDVQDRVFDWFETHSLGSHHRGTGLGLSLVRSFVELHGGTVALDSDIGRGTTVTCAFPLEHSAERTAA